MAIFHCYVSSPEGRFSREFQTNPMTIKKWPSGILDQVWTWYCGNLLITPQGIESGRVFRMSGCKSVWLIVNAMCVWSSWSCSIGYSPQLCRDGLHPHTLSGNSITWTLVEAPLPMGMIDMGSRGEISSDEILWSAVSGNWVWGERSLSPVYLDLFEVSNAFL